MAGASPKRILLVIKPQSTRKEAGKSTNVASRAVEFRTDADTLDEEDNTIFVRGGGDEHGRGEDVMKPRGKRRTRSRKRKDREDDDDREWTEDASGTMTTAASATINRVGDGENSGGESAELEDLWVSEEEVFEPPPVPVLSPESYSRIKITMAGGARTHGGQRDGGEASPRKRPVRTCSSSKALTHRAATEQATVVQATHGNDENEEGRGDEEADETEGKPSVFGVLNTDCLTLVFSYLETADLCRSARVCRHWRAVAHSRTLVKICPL